MLLSLQDQINKAVSDQRWQDAVDLLGKCLALTKDPTHRARISYTMAIFLRDHLNDPIGAISAFNQTLDEDPSQIKAFDGLEMLLRERRDWKGLERALRGLLKRLVDQEKRDDALLFGAWFKLGEVYGSRLNQLEDATAAMEQARAMHPQSLETHRALIDLYSRQQRYDDAIKLCRSALELVVQEGPRVRGEFYRALFTFYLHKRQFDRAWCVSSLLVHLKVAEQMEADFYQRYANPGPPTAQGRFNQEVWSLVTHPLESLRLSNIMAVIGVYCRPMYVYDLKQHWGLQKKHRLPLDVPSMVGALYTYMGGVLGMQPLPELYLNAEQPLGMLNGNVDPPAFIIGADMTYGHTPRELAFIIARQLALGVPQHYMAGLGLTDEILRFYMLGALLACSPTAPASPPPGVSDVVKQLKKMPTPARIELMKMVKPLLEGQTEVNLAEWLRGVDLTSNRIALLLCGDISTAVQGVRNENRHMSSLTPADRERDVIAFCTSDAYFEARERLGINVA